MFCDGFGRAVCYAQHGWSEGFFNTIKSEFDVSGESRANEVLGLATGSTVEEIRKVWMCVCVLV